MPGFEVMIDGTFPARINCAATKESAKPAGHNYKIEIYARGAGWTTPLLVDFV
jgi:hypothetical protein